MTTTLLIEIGVEELPTKAVTALATAGRDLWAQALSDAALAHGNIDTFATPRRLAWRIHDLAEKQPDQKIERKGPSLAAAKDKDGNWTKAALGFAASCGVEASDLGIEETPKGAWLTYHGEQAGQSLETLLPELFRHVCDNLPIAKRMGWGDNEQSFVRPVLTLVALADERILPLDYFGVRAGRDTLGHRVHHPEPVSIQSAASYEADLRAAHVIASHSERMARIREQVEKEAAALGGSAILPEALLIENASLTEWPVAISGSFDERYLAVPQEVLITTMQDNQKTCAVVGACGKIQPHFIAIANLESADPATVRKGNEKVIRPRFADAEFFWQQDLKHRLADYLPRLEAVTYQDKLGSLADKTRRLEALARELAAVTGADAEHAATAARLSKSDLLSEMVMEFPELQGIMGRYYAAAEGLPADIAAALDEQYYPRGAGGELPQSPTGLTLALAEKLDTLVGGFAIGAKPTGSKDPYALRRMAISLIRLINENNLNLPLDRALAASAATYPAALAADKHTAAVRDYIRERLDSYYREQGIRSETVQAVLALNSDDLVDNDRRIRALDTFAAGDNVKNLLASAKRIRNILKKNGERDGAVQTALLQEPAEQALWQAWQDKQPAFEQALAAGDYRAALEPLATLGAPLDAFFTDVMVMSDDPALQQNRLTLLTTLQRGFDKIADLSLLSE
ncbi:glycine--tRNA ligase subunit beta [uncultured Cardiobacterium sp.]|uniref:glycine--tRNA ligase subunit beta n=1 Tax=uncultured Cardiobacterium sp. TaxID=417619 RepID=UPI00260E2CA9|nr:glycine--tRNA ligase subunit beta [uncultured Cardiobacterium sp.]